MLRMLKSILKQRVNIQFCILKESSATWKWISRNVGEQRALLPQSNSLAAAPALSSGFSPETNVAQSSGRMIAFIRSWKTDSAHKGNVRQSNPRNCLSAAKRLNEYRSA